MKKTFGLFILTATLLFLLLPAVYASDYAYTIDNVTLADEYGESFSDDGGFCFVTAEITKNKETDGKDRVWFAGYDEAGRLSDVEYTDLSVKSGETGVKVAELISSSDKIDRVSVFIWSKNTNIIPLAEGVSKESDKEEIYLKTSLFSDIDENGIYFKTKESSSSLTRYKLSPLGTQIYINGEYYTDAESDFTVACDIIKASQDSVRIVLNSRGYVTKIESEIYVYAMLKSSIYKGGIHYLSITKFMTPNENIASEASVGNEIVIRDDDISFGYKKVYTEKNGVKCSLDDIQKNNILAIRYDIRGSLQDSEFIEILASSELAEAKFVGYYDYIRRYELYSYLNDRNFLFTSTCNRDIIYNVNTNPSGIRLGESYTFRIDAFGGIFDWETLYIAKNFAIVESYVDSTEAGSSYIEVMTLKGKIKKFEIADAYEETARELFSGDAATIAVEKTSELTAAIHPIESRIIEYSVSGLNKITKITKVDADNMVVYNGDNVAEYDENRNRLGGNLSLDVVVIDATNYTKKSGADITDYRLSSRGELKDNREYECILISKDGNHNYMYAIITGTNQIFDGYSNFTVAAEKFKTSSKAIVNNEDVYTLRVMEDGSWEPLRINISTNAKAYIDGSLAELTDIKAGTIFFYTKDADGFVDKISIVYQSPDSYEGLVGMTTENMLKNIYLPYLDNDNIIRKSDWVVSLDNNFGSSSKEEIQLMTAVTVYDGIKGISVSPVKYDASYGVHYVDTNESYDFEFLSDTRIYSFDMSGDTTGVSRFSVGAFEGVDTTYCDDGGRVWLGSVGAEADATDIIQPVFLMVVDGVVTNALVFTN